MAGFDPLDSSKNREPTEYGGYAGSPQPKHSGHPLTPGEKRRLLTGEGMDSARVIETIPDDDYSAQAVRDNQARRAKRLGDWTLADLTD